MSAVVQINNLTKKFGDFTAVQNLSLEIKKGESFAFLGPRGAGKSVILKILYGVMPLTTGEAFLLGLNVKDHIIEIKSRVGVVPQEGGLDPELTVLENLQVFGRFYEIPETLLRDSIALNLRRLNLEDKIDHLITDLTVEETKRASLARALVHKPELLLVDDFFIELKDRAKKEMILFFESLKKEGTSVVHFLEEHSQAEQICDRVSLIDHGRLLINGKPSELKSELIGQHILEFQSKPSDMNYYLQKIRESGFDYQVYQDTVNIFVKSPRTLKEAYGLISSDRITLRAVTLGDVFLRLSGRPLEAK